MDKKNRADTETGSKIPAPAYPHKRREPLPWQQPNPVEEDSEAKSIGLNIALPHEQYPNPYVTPDLCFRFHYFGLRKLHFLLRAKALVAFPGGYGTLDELFETLTLVQTRKIKPVPIVLVGESFWRKAFDIRFLVDEGVIDPEDEELFWFAETARDIWESILSWHEKNGTSFFGCQD